MASVVSRSLFAALLIVLPVSVSAQAPPKPSRETSDPPIVAGWIERVSLPEKSMLFEAKLDTGADSSSLNGRNIERVRVGGQRVVRFEMTDDRGKSLRLEAPVVRSVRVKRSGSEGDSRAVIHLSVCVGGQVITADFTVADRQDLNYQMLIGRNVLAGRILVDSARQRIVSDRCKVAE